MQSNSEPMNRMRPLVSTDPNGCTLVVLQQPDASSVAFAVQFGVGSHDEPVEWPGLAHFLEHLLFLGGERFSAEQRLMPFVQRVGGQINASTGATTTEYFFEVPLPQFEGAAERLQDMLVRPRLAYEDQLAEREVIDAEFQARATDLGQLGQSALMAMLGPEHGLSRFHAGHRETLEVENPAFQRALTTFHQQGYCAANCRVAVVGPQSAGDLLTFGRRWAAGLTARAAYSRVEQPLPRVEPEAWQLHVAAQTPKLWLGLRFAEAADGLSVAVTALAMRLRSRLPGGLLDALTQQGWVLDLRVHRLYDSTLESLLALEIDLVDEAYWSCVRAAVAKVLDAWAVEIAVEERVPLVDRPLSSMPPLLAARSCLQTADEELDADGRVVLRRLLAGLKQPLPAVLASSTATGSPIDVCGFRAQLAVLAPVAVNASLPADVIPNNPLDSMASEIQPAERAPGLTWLPRAGSEAVLFLRWRWASGQLPARGVTALSVRGLSAAAEQRGLTLKLEETIDGFLLQCAGAAARLPALVLLVADALRDRPPISHIPLPDEMPIRRLLRVLPDFVSAANSPAEVNQWDGLLVGMEEAGLHTLCGALALLPAASVKPQPAGAAVGLTGCHQLPVSGTDAAITMFYPVADDRVTSEAAWRVLGQWLAPRFYQRMRGDLQLGYGVFAGFHRAGTGNGLLFAIQSPTVSAGALIAHVKTFLEEQRQALATVDAPEWQALGEVLAARLEQQAASSRGEGELLWQIYLAEQPFSHLKSLLQALRRLSAEQLTGALETLLAPQVRPLILHSRG